MLIAVTTRKKAASVVQTRLDLGWKATCALPRFAVLSSGAKSATYR